MTETTNLQLDTVSDRVAIDAPLDAADACAYLKVTDRTLARWVELGAPVHRIGSGPKAPRRFYRSELDRWVRNRCSDITARSAAAS